MEFHLINSSIAQGLYSIFLKKVLIILLLVNIPAYSDNSLPFSELMRTRLEQLAHAQPAFVGDRKIIASDLIADAYTRNGFQPLWDNPQNIQQLMELIRTANDEGLNPDDYMLRYLTLSVASGAETTIKVVNRELLLSDAFFRLAYHYRFGKTNPKTLERSWNFSDGKDNTDPAGLLLQSTQQNSIRASLQQLLPSMPQYSALRKALQRYRSIASNGGWAEIPAGGSLKKSMISDRVPWLQSRLLATGDLAAGTSLSTDEFDGSLERAVYQFQLRHGLQADGIAGPETLAAMNIPIEQRIAQIRANMERLRWISRQLPEEYLLVDIAGFSVKHFLHGKENWSTRAVVGRPYRATPVFRSSMTHIVLNPSWTVPPTILAEDFLPQFRVDSSQLKKKNLSVIDNSGHEVDPATIDWSSATRKNFRYQLRQRPGPGNALGRIKFMFPNNYFVYLHDTPSKNLFGSSSRAYSSGCIRIEKPLELATLLLQKNTGWNYQRLLSELGNGQTRTIKLDWQIPVLLMYFTAEALDDNRFLFRNDLYNRDRTIIDALDQSLTYNASTDLTAWYH